MPLPQETFRADCASWNGYKPCVIQKADNRPDCFGCDQYKVGPSVFDIEDQPFDAELLSEAQNLGIVEMGGLGSIMRTTAVTRAIREINPTASINWFTHERGADLLRYVPGVMAINVERIDANEQKGLITNLDALINFELASPAKDVVLHAKRVGGFALNAQGKFHGVYPYAEYFQRLQVDDAFRQRNVLTMQQILLRSVGLEEHEARYDIALEASNYYRAEQILQEAFGNKPLNEIVGLNIGTSENGRARRWPAEYHAELAKRFAEAHPDKGVAILSGPQDEEARAQVIAQVGEHADNLAILPNNLEVGDFIAVVSKLDLLVTSNSFALHAARSQDVRVITFENPLPPNEMELSAKDVKLGSKLACGPCYNRCNQPIFAQCMREISVDEVADQIDRLLV